MWEKLTLENKHLLIRDETIVRYKSYDGDYREGLFKCFNDRYLDDTVWANWERTWGTKGKYYGHMPFDRVSFFREVIVDLDTDDSDCV